MYYTKRPKFSDFIQKPENPINIIVGDASLRKGK